MWPLIDQLTEQGVLDFFLSPGSRSTPLAIALSRHPKIHLHRHFDERGLGFYAMGFALGCRRPAAMVVTSGTAVGNLAPAVMEAHHASIPLLLLTADRPAELRENSANQTTDQLKMFQNFVRWQFEIDPLMPEQAIRSVAAQAVFKSLHPHPGPVHINCPFKEPLYPLDETAFIPGKPIPIHSTHSAALAPRSLPSKGIILAGRLPKSSDIDAILRLAQKLHWPIFADSLSCIRLKNAPEEIRYFDWMFWQNPPHPECILHFGERLISKRVMQWLAAIPPPCYIHISPYPHWCDSWHLQTERMFVEIQSACTSFTATIDPSWLSHWKRIDAEAFQALSQQSSSHFTETSAIQSISALALNDWAIFLANSMPIREADWFLFPKEAKGFFANRGLSGIDGNIATIVGLALALQSPVLAILGDLTALHDLNSIALIKTSPYPIILLISNNDGGGIFSHLSVAPDPAFETLFGFAHGFTFKCVAQMFQILYDFVDHANGLTETLTSALKKKQSCIIEMKTSRKKNYAHHQDLKKACVNILEGI